MNAQEFNKLASDSSKTFRLEAFSFTFDFGINIFFDDMNDLHAIIGETEIEFWQVEEQASEIHIDVSDFSSLKQVLEMFADAAPSDLEAYQEIVKGGYATWETVADWHLDNYFSEHMADYDFGHYLMHDVSCIEIPEALQGYISYESYGRDALINDFVVIGSNIYNNH